MIGRGPVLAATLAVSIAALPSLAAAQAREPLSLQGFGMAGISFFAADETFETVVDTSDGVIFGGGLRLVIPGGPYLEVGAWRFEKDGERVFVRPGGQVFPLGIPLTVKMTPLEITGGWRFHGLLGPRVTPYIGGGYTSMRYEETSEFADDAENVSERFHGYHLTGGVDARLAGWISIAGDFVWTRVAGAIGETGVAEVFEEDDLGGTSLRIRLILGR